MTNGAPHGPLGLATSSGWMTSEIFPQVIDHFIKYTLSSKEKPTLLIMDNHESHISLAVIEKAKENGVTILTLPPHCSHRLQPLDVSVYASFKAHYNSAVDNWMLHHRGQPMTIYQVAECVGVAHDRSMTPSNIKSGFKRSGIFPFDRDVFNESDFMSSAVTDRPEDIQKPDEIPGSSNAPANDDNDHKKNQEPEQSPVKEPNEIQKVFVSPEQFRGFPKAGQRKGTTKRKKGRSMIATDTPEKNIIEEKEQTKKKVCNKAVVKAKRKVLESSDEDEQDNISIYSENEDWCPEIDSNYFEDLERSPIIGDFVLVQFKIKDKHEKIVYFIGRVLKNKDENGDIQVTFYRKHTKMIDKFILPIVPDLSMVPENDVKMILPSPVEQGKTKRQTALLSFSIGFNNIDVR
jgi:hypothetical protein